MRKIFKADRNSKGLRVDKYLSLKFPEYSRSYFQELIKRGKVKIEGVEVSASFKLKGKEKFEVELVERKRDEILPFSIDVPIIYEDEEILIVDKPSGLISHPAGNKKEPSLIGALLAKKIPLSSISSRPGIVHRLDKDTSGVMVVAKTNFAHLKLLEEFKERRVYKEYLAVVKGIFKNKEGRIELPLSRLKGEPRMKVSFLQSHQALTFYKVIKESSSYSLVRLNPETGRMHQIRVHLSFVGYPVLGDKKYGGGKAERLFLHSQRIGFYHPLRGDYIEFFSPPPQSFFQFFNSY